MGIAMARAHQLEKKQSDHAPRCAVGAKASEMAAPLEALVDAVHERGRLHGGQPSFDGSTRHRSDRTKSPSNESAR